MAARLGIQGGCWLSSLGSDSQVLASLWRGCEVQSETAVVDQQTDKDGLDVATGYCDGGRRKQR